ncbi:MFS transporter [Rhizomonospora bruguierae]|uniref:MFS transporter n=1 Tax=Rhizomonospora bruguierae TaxID=1581705 RepID=UPI001BCE9489|nr:MFS transporter [Micromonospora sp. NBRC 107566]
MAETMSHTHRSGAVAPPDPRRWWALVLLCLAQFMVILDITVVNVALPAIGAGLGLERAALTWVVTAYTLCFGGLLMLGGRLADLLGRRRMFLAGLTLFTAASLAAGLAGDATTLLAARAGQGVGAALLSPAALSILTTSFHGGERHRALGVWAALGGSGAAAGVLVGGLLTSGPGWQWVFYVNVPIGVLVAALVPVAIAAGHRRPGRLDVPGALLVTAASAALIYALVRAGESGWLPALGIAILLYAVFVVVQRRVPAPLVPPGLLARRPMATGVVAMLTASALLISGFFLCSLLLQHLLGLSPLRTGLVFLPVAAATVAGAHLAGRLITRTGRRPVAAGAFGLAALGFALLAQAGTGAGAWTGVLPGFALAAAGLGAGFVIATTTALAGVDGHHAGTASGAVNTAHELGAAVGVAAVSAIAGASVGSGTAAAGGFTHAFWACAVAAAVVAVGLPILLPGGRPAPTDGPVFAH